MNRTSKISRRYKRGYWTNYINQRKKITEIFCSSLYFHAVEDCYKFTKSELKKHSDCNSILSHHQESNIALVQNLFPEYHFLQWKFTKCSNKFWNQISNQKLYMNWLAKEKNWTKKEDFYQITKKVFLENYGAGLLFRHKGKILQLLKNVYPEMNWPGWRFTRTPSNYWNTETQKEFLEYYKKKNNLEDLQNIKYDQIKKEVGPTFFCNESWNSILKKLYPDEQSKLNNTQGSKSQKQLFFKISKIFPNYTILMNYKTQNLKKNVELDIFIPRLMLAFEYQGEQHYRWHYLSGSPENQKKRDQEKKEICKQENIKLIEISYKDEISQIEKKQELKEYLYI